MDTNWDTTCIAASTGDVNYMTSLGLESNIDTAEADKMFCYYRGIKDVKNEAPILVLLHGYPQTNFMWRHVIPLLPKDIPLFIPDLPGYGRSSPLSTPHTKLHAGRAILSALHSILPSSNSPHSIILCGHDRGGRISHRLSVSLPLEPSLNTQFHLHGTIILDILPATTQWETATLKGAVGFYHWAFLPNIELATSMILAFGGQNWISSCIARWGGQNAAGRSKLQEHDAEKLYGRFFDYEHVIRASCDDYRASADEEVAEHDDDQAQGKKVDCDVLILYSAAFAATRGDIGAWREWMGRGRLELKSFGDGAGHFIAEECPEGVAVAVADFYNRHSPERQ